MKFYPSSDAVDVYDKFDDAMQIEYINQIRL